MFMNRSVCCIAVVAVALMDSASAFAPPSPSTTNTSPSKSSTVPLSMQRREMIQQFTTGAAAITTGLIVGSIPATANALDMDSFEKSLIEKDTTQCDPKLDPKCIPKLTPDEALCKYGVSGADARTEACRRVRAAGGQLPSKSSKGERSTQGWLNGEIAL